MEVGMSLNALVRLPPSSSRVNDDALVKHSLYSSRTIPNLQQRQQQRQHILVIQAKGKKGMMARQYQRPPPPSLPKIEDDGNPRFVVFIRMANVYLWYPLSIITGGTTAKIMVAAKSNFLGKYIYKDTLARNLAAVIYRSISGFEATTKHPYTIGASQMTQAASSNLGLHLPAPYGTSYRGWSRLFHFPQFFKPIKAMAGDSREKLDHLQKPHKNHSQPKRRVAPVAPIGLWDRFPTAKTVQQMMETMDRMMEDPFTFSTGEWPSSPVAPSEGGGYRRGRTPWEIKEGEDEYKMRFDMPGMTKEDVKVWVEEKMLVVKAEKAPKMKKKKNGEEEEVEEEEWSAKSYGRYNSRIALPENVQFEKIKAEVKDGVLYISIPKATSSSKILDINVQ